jgi:hypothetical protein
LDVIPWSDWYARMLCWMNVRYHDGMGSQR